MKKKKVNRSNINDFSSLPLFSESVIVKNSLVQKVSLPDNRMKVVSFGKFRQKKAQDQKASIISGYLLLAQKSDW